MTLLAATLATADWASSCDAALACLWRASWHASAVALLLLSLRRLRVVPRPRPALWLLLLVPLLAPALPGSRLSVFRFAEPTFAPPPVIAPPPPAAVTAPNEALPAAEVVAFGLVKPKGTTAHASVIASAKPLRPAWGTVAWVTWAVGVAVLLARLLVANSRFARRVANGADLTDPALLALLAQCGRAVGVRSRVRIRETAAVATPAAAGAWRPVILLPPGLAAELAPGQLRAVLLHELAHVRCRDVLVDWAVTLLNLVHWFNPVLWLAARRYRLDRELARDEMALRAAGAADDPAEYGRTLLQLVRSTNFPARPFRARCPGVVAMAAGREHLFERIAMIARFDPRRPRPSALGLSLVLLAGCATLGDSRHPAARNPATAPADAGRVTAVYDVRDLLAGVPDFDDPPSLGIAPAKPTAAAPPAPAPVPPSHGARVEQLVALIRETLAPSAWQQAPPVREMNGQLVITQSPDVQARVRDLLDRLRDARGTQVTVETRFFTLPDPLPQPLLDALPGGTGGTTFLDAAQANAVLRAVHADDRAGATIVTAPRVTLFSGQRAYVLIATQRAYVSNLTPVTGTGTGKDGTAYDPTIDTVSSGVLVDVRATASADRKSATLTLRPQLSRIDGINTLALRDGPNDGHAMVLQQPVVTIRKLQTTVSVPNDRWLLVRGFEESHQVGGPATSVPGTRPAATLPADANPPFLKDLMPEDASAGTLYLLVKATVIDPGRQPATFPPLKTAATRPGS